MGFARFSVPENLADNLDATRETAMAARFRATIARSATCLFLLPVYDGLADFGSVRLRGVEIR